MLAGFDWFARGVALDLNAGVDLKIVFAIDRDEFKRARFFPLRAAIEWMGVNAVHRAEHVVDLDRDGHDWERFQCIHHLDRKSTRLNSSHGYSSYAGFCLKKKKE